MPRSPAAIQAEIDQLLVDRAAVGVARATSSGDQSTTFQTSAEIDGRLARLQNELSAVAGETRTRLAAFDKGV